MHYRKIIALMGVPLFLASCAPKKAAPNASPIYFFAARPAPAQPAPVEMQGISDPERGLKSMSQAFKAGNFDAALKIARGLAEQHPGTSWYRRSLFLTEQVLIRMDRPSEADSAMLRVKAEYPEMADYAVFLLAEYHFSGGRFTQAAALYQDITERYPKSSLAVRAAYQQAQALHGASAFAPEADVLEAFLRNNPGSELAANAQLALGRALAAEARMDRAVQAYREVWVRYPGTAPDQEAVKALSELSASGYQVAPWTGDEWYERGKNLFRAARYDKSVEAFRKLLEAEPNTPNRPDALFRTGVALFHLGRRGDAAAALEKMVKQYPLDHRVPEALYWTGRSYGRLNEREKGIATLHKIVNAHPRSEWADDALFMIGNIYRDASDTRKALAVYSRLATEYPESKFADSALWWNAWTYYNAGEYAKVETALQELINRYPRSFLVHQARYWQGRTAEKTGNPAKAAEYYGKVLKRGPYTYYGYRAAERLSASPNLKEPIPVPDAVVDVIPAACEEEECLDGSPSPLETEDGPPVWTDETRQLLAAEPSFKKTLELMHLDMKKEAAAELWHLQGKVPRRRGALIGLSKAFFELGDYYRSLILVLRNYERYLDGEVRETPADLWLLAYPQGYWDSIVAYSRKYGQDPYLVAAIIRQESQFHPEAMSPAGARGVMQVMPATGEWIAQNIRLQGFDRTKLFESDMAINLGTWYIAHLMKRFKGDPLLVAAAYNAGPEAVAAWISRSGGILERDEFVEAIPFSETRGYVKKVLRNYFEYQRIYDRTDQGIAGSTSSGTGRAVNTAIVGDRKEAAP